MLYRPDTRLYFGHYATRQQCALAAGASRYSPIAAKTALRHTMYVILAKHFTLIEQTWIIPCSRRNHCISIN